MCLGFFTISFLIGTLTVLDENDASELFDEFNQAIDTADSTDIFLNNLSIGLPMFVPGAGPIWGMYSGWSTGVSFSAIISMSPELSDFQPLDIFFSSPFGFLELVAYSIGMSHGVFFILAIIQKSPKKSLIIWSLIEIGIAVILLFVGGVLELSTLEQEQQDILSIDDL